MKNERGTCPFLVELTCCCLFSAHTRDNSSNNDTSFFYSGSFHLTDIRLIFRIQTQNVIERTPILAVQNTDLREFVGCTFFFFKQQRYTQTIVNEHYLLMRFNVFAAGASGVCW